VTNQTHTNTLTAANIPAAAAPVAAPVATGTFDQLGLNPALLSAVKAEGYTVPTPIQLQAIPDVMAGRDLLGIAQTGTGKTAAFALPILHRLVANQVRLGRSLTRVLVLSPTRELASQIADSFRTYGRELPVRGAVVYGGVSFGPQARQLQSGVDVVVATPGRLLDHINQGTLKLDKTEIFVLDEADQMLDLGFMRDIRKIVAMLPQNRQNLFFSATMPKEIGNLAGELLRNPVRVQVTPVAKTADRVEQRVVMCEGARKRPILHDLLTKVATTRTLVFARTKRGADKVAEYLEKGGIPANAIHGNKSQGQRERALAAFRNGQCRVLVATDIAARGIDVDAVGHVINYDLPNVPESYVHRIGRTARAGAEGMAISLCDPTERSFLRDIERLIRQTIPRLEMPGETQGQNQRRAA
jgi:ATP-dependent RNA helicase RhlE